MLTLYGHPLSSYCWKALIALYENGAPFEFRVLADAADWADYKRLWPISKMPLLRDSDRGVTLPEATIIIEYLDQHHGGPARFVPADADAAREVRLWDRFFDNYVHTPMQKMVGDRIRPADKRDPFGVAEAQAMLATAYDVLEQHLGERTYVAGATFSLADCAAAPALCYGAKNVPLGNHQRVAAYLERLEQRPSFARVLKEAEPHFHNYPADYA